MNVRSLYGISDLTPSTHESAPVFKRLQFSGFSLRSRSIAQVFTNLAVDGDGDVRL